MEHPEITNAVKNLLLNYEAGELIMMQTVNRLYDLERDYKLSPDEIAEHITDEDIKDNYLAIPRR